MSPQAAPGPAPPMEPSRPDPDALLARVAAEEARERGGKLKVFLGAAPGVGKTFAMLDAARQLRQQGVDVVVGVVETHGRAETEALLEGLEVLPRQSLEYRGKVLAELDLDALLRRRPQVALVDELAHTERPRRPPRAPLAGRRGTARRRHRRLHHGQRPAPREPQRRRRADHRRPRARDRARRLLRPPARRRPDRPAAARADRAAAPGQGLPARATRRRRSRRSSRRPT